MNARLLAIVALFASLTIPQARAEGVDLGLGGYMIGYGLYNTQDTATPGVSLREFNLRKETKVEFSGETELDNGLKLGAVVEIYADRGDSELVDASTAYIAGGFGQFNLGEGDGAATLLQVEAPSADPYVDGMDPKINAFDLSELGGGSVVAAPLGYFHEPAGSSAKLVYLTPQYQGFQAAVSFTPAVSDADEASGKAADQADDAGEFENALEIGARYEHDFSDKAGLVVGAGYSHLATESDDPTPANTGSDDLATYNIGATVTYGDWAAGGAWLRNNNGIAEDGDTDIKVAGLNYALSEPLVLGVSYMDRNDEANFSGTANDIDIERYTAGAVYEYGPGLSFRGSISHLQLDNGTTERDGTQIAVGTGISF